jgi:outer membrane receptor protein involved in Fe transport
MTSKLQPFVIGAALVAVAAGRAHAQEGSDVTDVEVPAVVFEEGAGGEAGAEGEEDIDLANIVQSAARSVTTVQEAPAIVTVITDEEIAERHIERLDHIADAVPGYLRVGILHNTYPHTSVRGQVQAVQLLHDGQSLFDPYVNVATVTEVWPMELVKRVEFITGPGGVLWGSNSLLGIMNVITKDAEDVDGVEVGVKASDGDGNPQYLHGYVMYGNPDLADGDAKALVHLGFKTYKAMAMQMSNHLFSAPLPQPNGPMLYGPLTTADPKRSFSFDAFVKLNYGNWQLRAFLPYYERHTPSGFPGMINVETLPEDSRCSPTPDLDDAGLPGDGCADRNRTARDNEPAFFDRYGVLEYKTRTAGGRAGFTAKGYLMQFVRGYRVQVLSGIEGLLEGGLAFAIDMTTYRPGFQLDGDVELPANTRLLYGMEAFHEFSLDTVERSRQGDGIETTFLAPYELSRLPLPCPLERDLPDNPGSTRLMPGCPLTFAFPSSRTVFGAYANPQWRPTKKLILDAGARLQISPEQLGENSYGLTPTFAAAAVYNFIPNWHLKANFTQGFRPPAFNNLNSNGEAVQLRGEENLDVETTNAAQAELNARLWKGSRRIREVNFRVDYSYTQIHNLIQIVGGHYQNTADRAVNSVEFLGKVYVQGGHRLELAYTYLDVQTADQGAMRVIPNNWFTLTGIFNLVDDKLMASTALRVIGAHEDFNRLVEYRNVHYCRPDEVSAGTCMDGDIVNDIDPTQSFLTTLPTDLVLDRIPPVAELNIGVTFRPTEKLILTGEVINALDNLGYQPDVFFTLEPRLEFLPNPYERFRAYLGATYMY